MNGSIVTTHPMISMRGDASIAEAARLMSDSSVGALGVLDRSKRFSGIFTERDLTWLVAQRKNLDELTLAEVANDFPLVVDGPLTDHEATKRMVRAHVRHLIVKEDGDLRMFSMRDLVSAAAMEPDVTVPRLQAREIMSSPVVACRTEAFFEEIAEVLATNDISGLPVVDDQEHVVGVVSERDLAHILGSPLVRMAVRRHRPAAKQLGDSVGAMPRSSRRARHVMSAPVVGVSPNARLDELARLMAFHEINRVPVLDGNRLMGIVTRGDVLRAVGGLRRPVEPTVEHAPVVIGGLDRRLRDGQMPDLIDLSPEPEAQR